MNVRFTLSDAAFETLRAFCAENLKADLDATSYAEGLVSEYETWDGTSSSKFGDSIPRLEIQRRLDSSKALTLIIAPWTPDP